MNNNEDQARKIIDARLKNDINFWSNYSKIVAETADWEFRITSHLMLISGSVFAIMISLHGNEMDSCRNLCYFRTSMILCASCILFGALFLYSYIDIGRKSANNILDNAIGRAIEGNYASNDQPLIVTGKRIFWYCKLICWLSFLCSFVFLTLYSIFI